MRALSSERRRFLEKATLRYGEHVEEAEEYLRGRGLPLQVARSNALGVVRDPLPGHEDLEGRLVIPYLTRKGPVNMSFRCMEDHDCKMVARHSKYRFMRGMRTNLYGVMAMEEADEWIAVTEGEIDAITLNMIGIPAVGIPGAEKWEACWGAVFEDFSRVYVYLDGDVTKVIEKPNGDKVEINASRHMWETVSRELDNAIKVQLPDKFDVNRVYTEQGAEPLWAPVRRK